MIKELFVYLENVIIALNAKLKRRFGQTEGHDRKQVNEARRSYKMKDSKMADLSVVVARFNVLKVLKSHHEEYKSPQ